MVVPWEPWRTGDGVILPMFHHLQHLSARHQITVLAGSGGPQEQRVTGPERGMPDGVQVRWFGTGRGPALDHVERRVRGRVRGEPAHALFVERPGLLEAFAHEPADVVHLVGWGTAHLVRRTSAPAVHYAVDPWAASWRNRRLPPYRAAIERGQARLSARHEARHYPLCSSVAVVAEADAALLRAQVPSARFAVVPNGVSLGPAPAVFPAAPVLGLHGSFETQANVDGARALVELVWPRVRAVVPDAQILLAGRRPGPEVQALVQPGVTVLADVPDMRAVLDRTSVHVSWMTSGFGMKNKVLEAMAAGRPVVANSQGASGIGAGPGLYVEADPAAAAARIVTLLRDPVEAGADARDRVERDHSWAASAEAMEALWVQARR